jgi:hypothetical protein
MIYLQSDYGRSSMCGDAVDFEGVLFRPLKMVCPLLRPRVEQCNRLPRYWIFPVHVCPLTRVAMWTLQCQIGHIRLSAP